MNTLEEGSSNAAAVNAMETTPIKDDMLEINSVDTVWKMTSLETMTDENSTMNIDESLNDDSNAIQMSTLDTVCEMKTVETQNNSTVPMNTLDKTCEMDSLNDGKSSTIIMNTLETVCEMKTQDSENNSTVVMNTLQTASVMNTLETQHNEEMEAVNEENVSSVTKNTLKTVFETENNSTVTMDSLETASGTSTLETQSNNKVTTNCLETDFNSSNSNGTVTAVASLGNLGNVALASEILENTNDEPVCKRAKLEVNEPVTDSPRDLLSEDNSVHMGTENKITDAKNNLEAELDDDASSKKGKSASVEQRSPLTEIQAGITEYLGSHAGFSAVIKQRYSDFIVNEIDIQGKVVHLTQMDVPESLDEELVVQSEQQDSKITDGVISEEDIAKVENLLKSGDNKAVVNIIAPEDKDSRTKIHLAIKKRYIQLETKTAEVDKQKVIQIMWKTGKSRDKIVDDWPQSKKDCKYVKFVLYKENKDTMDAIGLIAKNLKLKEGLFQYAGTKDRRAKTSQEITAYKIHPKKLHFMNKVLWNMGLGNFQYVKEPLKLGQLSGNQFTIVLRNVQAATEVVDSAMSSLKTLGFINYFGMQRFGTTLIPTHKVGCALLHGDWEKAVDLILMPRDDKQPKDAFQKVWVETRDPEAALKVTPSFCGLERNLLEALKRKLKPFNALERISRNTRMLYVHSYQALVWNRMVSRRLKHFGMKPVVGDLVQTGDTDSTGRSTPMLVTEDNLEKFSIHDVVLPLPGYDVIYPKNEVHSWFREALASDGLDIDSMKRSQKDYSLPGAYRHITICPSSVSWSHHRYDDYCLPLTLSDMDVIKGEKLPATQNKGKYKATVLTLTLPASCYATMALREVLRVDTSVAHQTSLNVS